MLPSSSELKKSSSNLTGHHTNFDSMGLLYCVQGEKEEELLLTGQYEGGFGDPCLLTNHNPDPPTRSCPQCGWLGKQRILKSGFIFQFGGTFSSKMKDGRSRQDIEQCTHFSGNSSIALTKLLGSKPILLASCCISEVWQCRVLSWAT